MLKNFQLTAIVKQGDDVNLLRIPLHQALQQQLAENWQDQLQAFIKNVHEIDFDAGYKPEEHERFRLNGYEPPEWLAGENSQTVVNLHPITNNEDLMNSIRGIAAFARDAKGHELILFQNFSRSHVIKPGRFLLLKNETYETAKHPGLTLDSKLAAVYMPSNVKLLFQSFRIVNTFLPLVDFYKEASEQQIKEVLNHSLLAAEDADTLATDANQWFRKRFAMLRDSGVLDRYKPKQIQARAKNYGVTIHISNDKIVFPADKAEAKKLLQFLNEELFRGPITEELYETNSKRRAD